jgi:hypothetical protein
MLVLGFTFEASGDSIDTLSALALAKKLLCSD